MRKALLCPRASTSCDKSKKPVLGKDFEASSCMDGSCETCENFKLLPMCAVELQVVRPITYMSKEMVEYVVTNNGDIKKRKCSKLMYKYYEVEEDEIDCYHYTKQAKTLSNDQLLLGSTLNICNASSPPLCVTTLL
jgi:hypothetical protein